MRKLKPYLETSVWNFYYADDAPEKQAITQQFFHSLPNNSFEVYVSEVVIDEFNQATLEKRIQLFQLIDRYQPIMLVINQMAVELANAYLQHQVLPRQSYQDAQHIAIATVYELDAIVSWNLKHIANLHRQKKVQTVNLINGYTKFLQLTTPMEASYYEP